jgi:hypothetical protein
MMPGRAPGVTRLPALPRRLVIVGEAEQHYDLASPVHYERGLSILPMTLTCAYSIVAHIRLLM